MITNQVQANYCSDTIVWNSFKNGDKKAFATLYYRYFGILLHTCFRYSKDTKMIEDCIHDLFLEIWNNKVNLATPVSVKAYLLCSTQRKILRQLKRNRNYSIAHTQFSPQQDIANSIEDKLISDQNNLESKRKIMRAINALTKRQKEAVSLRYYDNLSYTEIAAIMAISVDAVYNLVSKALDNIEKSLQKGEKLIDACLN